MQLKYSFKKEWSHFTRTGRLFGFIAAIFSFALSQPLMFRLMASVMEMVDLNTGNGADSSVFAAITGGMAASAGTDPFGGMDIGMEEIMSVYSDAGMIFASCISTFSGLSLLIVMLLLMAASGGEQKKRAMIVPMCSGLEYKSYLLPKFVIYPLITFALTFISVVTTGYLCNALFPNNHVSDTVIFLSAAMYSVYLLFAVCVYMSIGLCTSRPGVAAVLVFIGQTILQSLFTGMGLTDYNPFTLVTLPTYMTMEEFDLTASTPSILVGMGISVVVAVLMFFLTLGVLGAKKIDNTEEERPEF